jgi:hypothetical protein
VPERLFHDLRRSAARKADPVRRGGAGRHEVDRPPDPRDLPPYGIVDESMLREGAAKQSALLGSASPERKVVGFGQ